MKIETNTIVTVTGFNQSENIERAEIKPEADEVVLYVGLEHVKELIPTVLTLTELKALTKAIGEIKNDKRRITITGS